MNKTHRTRFIAAGRGPAVLAGAAISDPRLRAGLLSVSASVALADKAATPTAVGTTNPRSDLLTWSRSANRGGHTDRRRLAAEARAVLRVEASVPGERQVIFTRLRVASRGAPGA